MMKLQEQERLVVDAGLSKEPQIGRWLWALEDARKRTKAHLEELSSEFIDWPPPFGVNSIGTLLYHVALVEADWLYVEMLEQAYAPAIVSLFPHPVRDAQDRLTNVAGVPLADHIMRLDAVREQVLQVFQTMTLDDFRRARQLPDYDVTPEWVLHHLMQHEAEHRSEIAALRHTIEHRSGNHLHKSFAT